MAANVVNNLICSTSKTLLRNGFLFNKTERLLFRRKINMSSRTQDNFRFIESNKRYFNTSACRSQDQTPGPSPGLPQEPHIFTFDTLEYYKALRAAGFDDAQAEAIKKILVHSMLSNYRHMDGNFVSNHLKEVSDQQMLAQISAVRKDMIILEKSEFSQLKHEYEKQNIEIKQIKTNMHDELAKLNSGITLSINLEKARSTEAHHNNRDEMVALSNRLDIKLNNIEGTITNLDSKIERENARLEAQFERYKNEIIRYSVGTIISGIAMLLAFYRLMKP